MHILEHVSEVVGNSLLELLGIPYVNKVLVLTQILLQELGHLILNVIGNLVPIEAMAVTDTEQVEALVAAHIGRQRVRVLVHLVRIAWLVTTRRGKGKLGDRVEALLPTTV